MRRAGILLHISSLPSRGPIGDLGPAAHDFARWLHAAGCSSWQVLPLNPMGPSLCPYASASAMAAEPLLISLDGLVEQGLLKPFDAKYTAATDEALCKRWKRPLLEKAAKEVKGEVIDDANKCQTCKGKKVVKEKKVLDAQVDKGAPNNC